MTTTDHIAKLEANLTGYKANYLSELELVAADVVLAAARQEERERCAIACENVFADYCAKLRGEWPKSFSGAYAPGAMECRDAIRALTDEVAK